MKTGITLRKMVLTFAAAAWLQGCQKAPVETPTVEEPPQPPPVVAASPAPTVAAAATPVPDPIAPPGIFFLLQKISIVTDDGIVGLKPGQLVREVSPGVFEADGKPLEVRPSQLTNNLRIARELASQDAGAQAALRAASLERQAPPPLASTSAGEAPKPPGGAANTVRSTPVPHTGAALSSSAPTAPRLGGGTGSSDPEFGNRKNVKVDRSGRMYWHDSSGRARYDF